MGEKDYERIMRLLQKEVDLNRKTFTKEELMDAYESYLNKREKQLMDLQVLSLSTTSARDLELQYRSSSHWVLHTERKAAHGPTGTVSVDDLSE
jgi:hypothetical protein